MTAPCKIGTILVARRCNYTWMETGEQRSSYITDPGDVLLVVSMDVHFFWTATEFVVCLYEGRLVFMAAHNARNPDNFDRVVTE